MTLRVNGSVCFQVTSLSGGERRRLQLAAVLVEKPNLLIMDEPTNDLDLQTVEVVEELLSDYKGCLLVVSHDRTFMENLADRLFVVTGDGLVRMFDGLYSEVSCAVAASCNSTDRWRCELLTAWSAAHAVTQQHVGGLSTLIVHAVSDLVGLLCCKQWGALYS